MSYLQVRKPNLSTIGRSGWCLVFARRMFNINAKYPTAWRGWLNAKRRYTVTPHPKNVAVPIWFSFIKGRINYGHVVIYVPKKGYYSSPYKRFSLRAVLPSIKEVERVYSAKYVGWSEDINGVSVVKRVAKPKPTPKPAPKPAPKHKKIVIQKGDGISHLAKRAGYSSWRLKSSWQHIAELNKYKKWQDMQRDLQRGGLRPGMWVRVK